MVLSKKNRQKFAPGSFCLGPASIMVLFLLGLFFVLGSSVPGQACSKKKLPERIDAVMIGERIVATAWRLGVAPRAMVGRTSMWEDSDTTSGVVEFLSCPSGFAKKKQKSVVAAIVDSGIALAYVEEYPETCLYMPDISFDSSCAMLDKQGVAIKKIDFTRGLFPGVEQIGKIFGKEEEAKKAIDSYEKSLARAKKKMAGVRPGIRVAVVSGVYQAKTGKGFMRMEAEKGYTDRFILDLCRAENISSRVARTSDKIDKGHFMVRKIGRILEENPDVIVITGDAFSVAKAINTAVANNPALGKAKAVSNAGIFSLPFYGDADPLGYPEVLMKWALALEGV